MQFYIAELLDQESIEIVDKIGRVDKKLDNFTDLGKEEYEKVCNLFETYNPKVVSFPNLAII